MKVYIGYAYNDYLGYPIAVCVGTNKEEVVAFAKEYNNREHGPEHWCCVKEYDLDENQVFALSFN
jgi:hypothetical protein